jgi:phage terminase large subunit
MFKTTPLYLANYEATEDIIVNQGGTYSSKTYTINQVLFSLAISEPNRIITIVGESIPNLKKGAMRDFDNFIGLNDLSAYFQSQNKTDRVYKTNSGSTIEFTSYVTAQDAHSGKRDYLFLNEAPGISWAIAEQLINRTNIRTFIDYNPSIPFWVHEKLLTTRQFGAKKVKLIISDHRHNPFLSKEQHEHIELRSIEDPEWGKVYGRGLTGKVEGLVFRNWVTCEAIPKDATLLANGLDFGFTNDPSASLAVYKQDGELFIDELLYSTGLTNDKLAEQLKDKHGVFICDSAEPKSIVELRNFGLKVEPAIKGADSIQNSIDMLKRYKMNITSRSVNLIKELNSYKWKVDKVTGNNTREPVDYLNHAIDALRYVALNRLKPYPSGTYTII